MRTALQCVRTRVAGLLVSLGLIGCARQMTLPNGPPLAISAQDIRASVFLIGDAGAPRVGGEPVLRALESLLPSAPASSVVVFLGDNIYPRGLPGPGDPDEPEAVRRLTAQVVLSSHVPVVFVPGNHDWDKSGREGWERIQRQGRLVVELSGGRAQVLPSGGCPGPVRLDVDTGLRLILLDTEWWLHPGAKPAEGSTCPQDAEAEVIAALQDELREADGRQVIVVGHHPLLTRGPHGGYFPLVDHIFPLRNLVSWLYVPLPVLGSHYPLVRSRPGSSKSIRNGAATRSSW